MFTLLNNRALLKVSGSDAETFLQGQLSNDINKLNASGVQLNAYCQHQGKILVLFWVMRRENSFFLSFPSSAPSRLSSQRQLTPITT